jgi:hypothetical protein
MSKAYEPAVPMSKYQDLRAKLAQTEAEVVRIKKQSNAHRDAQIRAEAERNALRIEVDKQAREILDLVKEARK